MTITDSINMRGSVPHFYIRVGGDLATDAMQSIHELTIESSLHMPDVATLILRDLTPLQGQGSAYKYTDDTGTYKVGQDLKISIKVEENREENVFDGEIVEVEPHLLQHGQQLKVRAYDRLHKLSRGTYTRTFQNVTDMDVVKKIAGELGLAAQVGPASFVHDYVIQSNQTNLDFLRERALRLGYLLYVDGTTLHCEPMGAMGSAGEVKWGTNLIEFSPRLSSIDQASGTTVRGWDPDRKKSVVSAVGKGKNGVPEVQASGEEDLAAPYTVTQHVVRKEGLAELYASGSADQHRQKFVEASGTTGGHPKMTAGQSLDIGGVSDRYKGKYTLSSVTHHYRTESGYTTDFQVSGGRPSDIANTLAERQKPSTQPGLVIGIVTNNDDPKNQGRVKVKFPWLSEKDESDWARVATLGGGNKRGAEWIPEVNDEVLVGFEQGDMHHPYILGGLWNGVDVPPEPVSKVVQGGKTVRRVHYSRLGHKIVLDDSDQPGILVEDMNGNQIKIDSKTNTLTITMKGDVKVQAQGKMELSAQQGVSIEGGAGGVDIKGSTIKLNS